VRSVREAGDRATPYPRPARCRAFTVDVVEESFADEIETTVVLMLAG